LGIHRNMSLKKVILLIFAFYFLVLLETSFLVHFNVFLPKLRWYPSLILLAVILLNLFEGPKKSFGIFAAVFGGFFWDIFSTNPIGFHILILVMVALLIKIILGQYVRTPFFRRF